MKILGKYIDRSSSSLRVTYNAQIALEVDSVIEDTYSGDENDTKWYVKVRSGCYIFLIKTVDGDYYDKAKADGIVRKIAVEDIVILDDIQMALFDATDVTPEDYAIRNAIDVDYNEIPLLVKN